MEHHFSDIEHLGMIDFFPTKSRIQVYAFIPRNCGLKISIRSTNPHFQESIRHAVYLCAFFILVGQKLFLQQGANGVLDGTGRFERMLLYETGRGGAAGFTFLGNGPARNLSITVFPLGTSTEYISLLRNSTNSCRLVVG